jgi:hypothetical protein
MNIGSVVLVLVLLVAYFLLRNMGKIKLGSGGSINPTESHWSMIHRVRRRKAHRNTGILIVILVAFAAIGVFVFAPDGTAEFVSEHWQGWTLLGLAFLAMGFARYLEDTLEMGYIPTYLGFFVALALFVGAIVKFVE